MKYIRIFKMHKLTKFDTIHTWYCLCVSDDFLSIVDDLLENDDKCVCVQKFGSNYMSTKNDIYEFICSMFDKNEINYRKYDDHLKFYVDNDQFYKLELLFDMKADV